MTSASLTRWVPPYVSFRRFLHQIEVMESKGVPQRLDRAMLIGLSGPYQAQVMQALRALGMIDTAGVPMPVLHDLATRPADRRHLLAQLVSQRYPEAVRLAAGDGTPALLADEFKRGGLSGDTLRKAAKFFLHAANYAGIPVNEHLRGRRTPSEPLRRQTAGRPVPRGSYGGQADQITGAHLTRDQGLRANQHIKTVALGSGGHVSLAVSVDIFALSVEDRQFVVDLVDRINGYASRKVANP
jgi:hypothetical protein